MQLFAYTHLLTPYLVSFLFNLFLWIFTVLVFVMEFYFSLLSSSAMEFPFSHWRTTKEKKGILISGSGREALLCTVAWIFSMIHLQKDTDSLHLHYFMTAVLNYKRHLIRDHIKHNPLNIIWICFTWARALSHSILKVLILILGYS